MTQVDEAPGTLLQVQDPRIIEGLAISAKAAKQHQLALAALLQCQLLCPAKRSM